MADKLNELYNEWVRTQEEGNGTLFQAFQAGLTAGAVSMRERAMACAAKEYLYGDITDTPEKEKAQACNRIQNAIGQLSDIPE